MPAGPSGPPLPSHYDDLEATHDEAWGLLVRGAADRRAAFHTPTVATIGLDGRPRLRTVVLRGVDARARALRFHTDARSAKVAELARDDRIAVHFYDPGHKVQIRIEGQARLMPHDVEAWARSQAMSRICYAQIAAPGTPTDDPVAAATVADDTFGIGNFVAVAVAATALEWLYLAHAGHRRALFKYEASQLVRRTWLAP